MFTLASQVGRMVVPKAVTAELLSLRYGLLKTVIVLIWSWYNDIRKEKAKTRQGDASMEPSRRYFGGRVPPGIGHHIG